MKKLLIYFLFIVSINSFSQGKMNEERVMKETHIDFSKEEIFFTLDAEIEIDGHSFKNSECKCPIIYHANLTGVTLSDTCTKATYIRRICEKPNCKIIHLIKKDNEKIIGGLSDVQQFFPMYRGSNGLISR